jgi:hypothetical protein
MIASLRQGTGMGERQGYASALAGLWTGLSRTLARLEAIAADPERQLADEETLATLPALQYALHCASELAYGIDPPAGAESAHAELAAALADARDTTSEVADGVEASLVGTMLPLVLEWRGALFRVRLARMRLAAAPAPRPVAAEPEPRGNPRPYLAATLLILAGAVAFAAGTTIGPWPVWAGGLALVLGGWAYTRP